MPSSKRCEASPVPPFFLDPTAAPEMGVPLVFLVVTHFGMSGNVKTLTEHGC